MAPQMLETDGSSPYYTPHVCSIIPPRLLQHILDNSETSEPTRAAVQKTYNHVCKLQASRAKKDHHHAGPAHGFTAGIVPPQIFRAVQQSEHTSSEQKAHAEKNLELTKKIHTARTGADSEAATATKHLYRALYTSSKTDTINKTLLFEEGAATAARSKDQDANEVYDFFGKTYQFYSEVCVFRVHLSTLFIGCGNFKDSTRAFTA